MDNKFPNDGQYSDSFANDFLAQAKATMSRQAEQTAKVGRALTEEEDRKMQDGFALEEMMRSAGWSIVQEILQNMPKAHIDPRGKTEEDWKFAELNAFWSGAVATELLDGIYQIVGDAHQLQKIKLGEVQETQKMRL